MKKLDPKLRRIARSKEDQVILRRDLESAITHHADTPLNEDGAFPDGEIDVNKLSKNCFVLHSWATIPARFSDLAWRRIVGNVYAVDLPLTMLEELAEADGVQFIEAGRTFMPMLSSSRDAAGITPVHNGVPGRTGTGVVVGIIDTGLDYTLDDFRNDDGTSRVAFLWDQSLNPLGGEASPVGFHYGVEYTAADLDAAIAGTANVRHQSRPESHGTHVAGIAAGNGRGNDATFAAGTHIGAAPDATIIHVMPDSGDQDSSFTDSTNVADAIAYIFGKADDLGLPCVINMSLGQNGGSHDGESVVERAIDELLQIPGRAFVSAAGNEHTWRGHASGQLQTGEQRSLRWQVGGGIPWPGAPFNGQPLPPGPVGDFTSNEMEIWFSSRDDLRVRVHSPGGEVTNWVGLNSDDRADFDSGNSIYIDVERFTILNGDSRIYIEVEPGTARVEAGEWLVELDAIDVRDGRFDAFIERDARILDVQLVNGQQVRNFFADQSFFKGQDFDPVMTLGTPATSRRGIAVANYDHVVDEPNFSSSRGPTRDQRHKPEVAAPGTNIVASNAQAGQMLPNGTVLPVRTSMTGTSMSAPHVAGIIALLFEENRDLTSAQIQKLLIASASSHIPGDDFDNAWGYGAVDAAAAMALLRAM